MRPTADMKVAATLPHVVEFYDDAAFPAITIARHLGAGLRLGCAAFALATPSHAAAIAQALGPDAARVTWLDADTTLAALLVDGQPDHGCFERVIGELVRGSAAESHPVYAYGELVDVLTQRGQLDGALALEDLWNALAAECPLELFCGYSLSSFGCSSDAARFASVCDRHSGVHTRGFGPHDSAWWATNARIVRRTREVLDRRQQAPAARLSAASDLRDELIGIASHELRNPVHVLSLNLRAALTAIDGGAPTAGVRMRIATAEAQVQRLSALLDRMLRTSGLLAGEMGLEAADFDLADAVSSVLGAMAGRLAASNITVDLQPVTGRWDRGRVEQVVEHLLSHAITFSGGQPIRLSLQGFPDFVYFSLCDCGVDDRDAPMPSPSSPETRDPSTTDLGLWTARQLADAMGGTITTARPGASRFRVILTLPRTPDHSL